MNKDYQLNRLPKKAFEILVTIPWAEIEKARDQAINQAGETLEIDGFRKGKAPANLVKEALNPQKLLELTLQQVIPDYYQKAVKQESLNPILTPKIELVSAKENEPWQVKFISCEEPEVNLGNYKQELKKEKSVSKIWTPEKGTEKEEKKPEEDRDEVLNKVISWLAKNIKVEICDMLIEEEVARRLSGLIEQTQKLGVTIDQYLSSVGKTVEQIREEYRLQAQETLALEFIFAKISEEEKIEIKPEEIQKVIESAKSPEEKQALEAQSYYIATILRRQKTLDFLASL